MQKSSMLKDVMFNELKPNIDVLFETEGTKEIRIVLNTHQSLKEHKTPFPIVVQIVEGEIEFGLHGEKHRLQVGDLIAVDANIPHDLFALAPSIVRLSLAKGC